MVLTPGVMVARLPVFGPLIGDSNVAHPGSKVPGLPVLRILNGDSKVLTPGSNGAYVTGLRTLMVPPRSGRRDDGFTSNGFSGLLPSAECAGRSKTGSVFRIFFPEIRTFPGSVSRSPSGPSSVAVPSGNLNEQATGILPDLGRREDGLRERTSSGLLALGKMLPGGGGRGEKYLVRQGCGGFVPVLHKKCTSDQQSVVDPDPVNAESWLHSPATSSHLKRPSFSFPRFRSPRRCSCSPHNIRRDESAVRGQQAGGGLAPSMAGRIWAARGLASKYSSGDRKDLVLRTSLRPRQKFLWLLRRLRARL
nr:hypothetical protein Iba_chr11aCG12900 [Ipomoea batatas]